jgi:hypothetical protein
MPAKRARPKAMFHAYVAALDQALVQSELAAALQLN